MTGQEIIYRGVQNSLIIEENFLCFGRKWHARQLSSQPIRTINTSGERITVEGRTYSPRRRLPIVPQWLLCHPCAG
jgi:hypothetical protein